MGEYILYPDETYVGELYPYAVPNVAAETTLVHSPMGSEWERVGQDDTDAEALGDAILSIFEGTQAAMDASKVSIERLVPSNTGAEIGELVAAEIWNSVMKADAGEFMTVNAGLIEANQIRADQLEAGIMNGQTIIGSEFRSQNGKLVLDSTGLRAFTSANKLGVEITGEAATITAGTFTTPTVRDPATGTDSWSTFGSGGFFCYEDNKQKFAASAAYPLGAACWDPASQKLQPISQFVFGPVIVGDDRWQDVPVDNWREGLTYWFTAPSSRMFMFLEFDCEFTGHYDSAAGVLGHADYIWDLRDESQTLVKQLWRKDDAGSPGGYDYTYNLYPHWSTCQVADTTPGQLYKLTLWGRKSNQAVNETDTAKFGYATAVLFAS